MQIDNNISSPNFDDRPHDEEGEQVKIEFIIIHYTEISFDETIDAFLDEKKKVSAHFVIDKNGKIYNLVNVYKRAWHAGISYWAGRNKLNDNSIGIELVNNGNEKYTDEQMISLMELLKSLKRKFSIKRKNILGHSDVACNRKKDPGIYFDWQMLAKNDLALSWKMPSNSPEKTTIIFKPEDSNLTNLQENLKKIGYNIMVNDKFDTNMAYIISSFRKRYLPHTLKSNDFNLEEMCWDSNCEFILQQLINENKF